MTHTERWTGEIVECPECGHAIEVVRTAARFDELIESHDNWMHRAKLAEKALQVARGEEPTPIYPGDDPPALPDEVVVTWTKAEAEVVEDELDDIEPLTGTCLHSAHFKLSTALEET